MTRNRNAPALAKRESVECRLLAGGDIGVDSTIAARVQYLVRSGLSKNRAALLSSIAFGEAAHG
jgi:hypothetical protein